MRRLAGERGIEVYDGVAEDLPFAAGSFDYALMVTTICFVDSLTSSLQEVQRVLCRGGRFIVGFVDRDSDLVHRANEAQHLIHGLTLGPQGNDERRYLRSLGPASHDLCHGGLRGFRRQIHSATERFQH